MHVFESCEHFLDLAVTRMHVIMLDVMVGAGVATHLLRVFLDLISYFCCVSILHDLLCSTFIGGKGISLR